jgi:DNA-binding MarR family transcriptional regulator
MRTAKTTKIQNLFLQERPAQILLALGELKEPYISMIAKRVDCTFAHASRTLKKMKKLGLVSFTREGRMKYVQLTEKGERVAALLNEMKDIFLNSK